MRQRSDDPTARAEYHATMALVGALGSVAAFAITWARFEDGWIMALPAGAALVRAPLTGYHFTQWARFRAARAAGA